MDQDINSQIQQVTIQNQVSNTRRVLVVLSVFAFVVALILDFINDKQNYVNYYWVFTGSVLVDVLEIYILYGFLKLFKVLDTSFIGRFTFVGFFIFLFDILQYFLLPKSSSGDTVQLSIFLVLCFAILCGLTGSMYKTKFWKTIGLALSFLVTIFIVSGLIAFLATKLIS
jgi:hypothetical protein